MEAKITFLRPVRTRIGRAVYEPRREIFGWPCALVLALEDGRRAYLLDYEHATQAPSQLRIPLDPCTLDSWRAGQVARVIVQSIFGQFIVVGVDWSGGREPDGAFGVAEAA